MLTVLASQRSSRVKPHEWSDSSYDWRREFMNGREYRARGRIVLEYSTSGRKWAVCLRSSRRRQSHRFVARDQSTANSDKFWVSCSLKRPNRVAYRS